MRVDANLFTPFHLHFLLSVLESGIATELDAKRRESHYIKILKANTAAGYNEAPGCTERAWWFRSRRGMLARK